MNKYPKLTIVLLVTVTQLALHALEKREQELHLGADSSGHNGVKPAGQNGSVYVGA